MKFSSAKVVILGGSSGIGFALAQELTLMGAQVCIAGSTQEKLQNALSHLDKQVVGHVVDITVKDSLSKFFATIGAFDHLIITATKTLFKPFDELTENEILTMIQTKMLGSFFAAQCAVKHLNPSGSITFFGGVVGKKAMKNGSVVALINSGLEGLTRTLALELAPKRVNLIAPGIVDTGRWDKLSMEEKKHAKFTAGSTSPVQRVGEPADLVNATIMVLENTFVTGSVVRVDGGSQL